MAWINTLSTPFPTSGFPSIAEVQANLTARWKRYGRYRQTLRELSAMSDRDLTDVGISRSDIRQLARESADYGDRRNL